MNDVNQFLGAQPRLQNHDGRLLLPFDGRADRNAVHVFDRAEVPRNYAVLRRALPEREHRNLPLHPRLPSVHAGPGRADHLAALLLLLALGLQRLLLRLPQRRAVRRAQHPRIHLGTAVPPRLM